MIGPRLRINVDVIFNDENKPRNESQTGQEFSRNEYFEDRIYYLLGVLWIRFDSESVLLHGKWARINNELPRTVEIQL